MGDMKSKTLTTPTPAEIFLVPPCPAGEIPSLLAAAAAVRRALSQSYL